MKFQGSAMLVRWWSGPPVIVMVPSNKPICIRMGAGPIPLCCKVPLGTMRGLPLTEERKQFLVRQELNPELIESGLVFDVSEALAAEFDKQNETYISLAERCGLTQDDLNKIQEAKKTLACFNPSSHTERNAKRGLESLFSVEKLAKSAGRPKRISAEERRQLRQRADEMKAAGQSRDDIAAQFSEEFELGHSYVRRILEDRSETKQKL
jgi:hypothetical protein